MNNTNTTKKLGQQIRSYSLSNEAHRRLVASGVDTPQQIEITVDVPRDWITRYPLSVALECGGDWELYGSSDVYAPGLYGDRTRKISAESYLIPPQDKLLSPAEYLALVESEIIRHTTDTEVELARRLEADRQQEEARLLAEAERDREILQLAREGKLYQSIGGTWTKI